MKDSKKLAIEAALRQDWDTAVKINETLLKENPIDVEALNRLAFALMEKGELTRAKKYYKKILALDSYNPIAIKNLGKLVNIRPRAFKKKLESTPLNNNNYSPIDVANLFLEEIGKTKVVKLKNLAENHIISQLKPGDEVVLSVKRRGVSVFDQNNTYLGVLPDDVAHRLVQFIKYGNQYQAFAKSIEKNSLTVFIREVKRSARIKNQPSFSNTPLTYLSSVRDEAFESGEKPSVSTLEELEEEGEIDKEQEEEST